MYDFSPLIEQLKPLAVEEAQIQKAEREAKEARMTPAWKKKGPAKLKVVAPKVSAAGHATQIEQEGKIF